MEQPVCPACKSKNADHAVYCDQCGQHLLPPDPAADSGAEGACPACGGAVKDVSGGRGVCLGCGLELHAAEGEAPVKVGAGAAARLTATILRLAGSGMPLEKAVAEACAEVLAESPDETAAPDEPAAAGAADLQPCPLCGFECSEEAPRCAGCGIWFHHSRAPRACPRCDRQVTSDKCECGAILTLPRLLQYIEPAVRCVCSRCKSPYAVVQPKCPDCGAELLSADRIKKFAAFVA